MHDLDTDEDCYLADPMNSMSSISPMIICWKTKMTVMKMNGRMKLRKKGMSIPQNGEIIRKSRWPSWARKVAGFEDGRPAFTGVLEGAAEGSGRYGALEPPK